MSYTHSLAHADATRRRGKQSDCATPIKRPMQAANIDRLISWFSGETALTRAEAHELLDSAVESGQIAQYRAEFVAAIKALAVDAEKWHETGYRLLPDH